MTLALGPFTLDRRIAAGGMGEVWSGRHVAQGVPVAVKMITGDAARDPAYYQHFRREVQAAAALDHPGIVTLFDYGSLPEFARDAGLVPGSPYLVMEFADGAVDTAARGWSELKTLLLAILEALAHAHARGIVHRDLKPGNILRFGAGPAYKLADFGIARSLDVSKRTEEFARAEAVVGTPHYMPPEQWTGAWRDHGPWTDLYALGVIAFELATGNTPFDGTANEVMYGHLQGSPPSLHSRIPVPDGFEAWVRRMLEKAHWQRFKSARQAAVALEALGDVPDPEPDDTDALRADSGTVAESEPLEPSVWKTEVEPDLPSADLAVWKTVAEPELSFEAMRGPTVAEPPAVSAFERTGTVVEGLEPAPLVHRATVAEPEFSSGPSVSPPSTVAPLPIERGVGAFPPDWRREAGERRSMRLVGAGLGLFGLREMPVVDRDAHRTAMWDRLSELTSGPGVSATVLRGAAGVGKSRLARWLCEEASAQAGFASLQVPHQLGGAASDGIGRLVEDIFRLRGLDSRSARKRIAKELKRQGETRPQATEEIVGLLGLQSADGTRGSSIQVLGPTERHLVVLRVLERVTRHTPAVVWIDDGQWGYDALHFVRFVLDRDTEARVHFVITSKDEALHTRPLEEELLDDLEEHPSVHSRSVGPLLRADVSELIERMLFLSHDVAERLVDRVSGNPLFAVQLVADWVQRGVLRVGDGGFELDAGEHAALPDDLHAVWGERIRVVLDQHPPGALETLEAAATLGRAVDERELAAVLRRLGVSLSDSLLESLVIRRLASRTDDGWAFEHGLLQESLQRSARDAGRFRAFASACAAGLKDAYPRAPRGVAERIARFHAMAGEDEPALAAFMIALDERTAASDYALALALANEAEQAARRLPLPPSDARWGRLWNRVARLHRLQWKFDDARAVVDHTLAEALAHGWTHEFAEATAISAHLARQGGDLDRARALNDTALARFREVGDTSGEASTMLAMAIIARQVGDLPSAERTYAEARDRFEAMADRESVGKCLAGLGNVYRSMKRNADAAAYYDAARAIFEEIGARHELANAINNIAEIRRYEGRLEEAEARYREAIALHEAIGSNAHIVPQLNLGVVLRSRGDHAAARTAFLRGAAELEQTGQRAFLAWTHANLLDALARTGALDDFDDYATSAESLLAETSMVDPDIAEATFAAGEYLMDRGDRARAARALAIARAQWVALDDLNAAARVDALLEGETPV